MSPLLLVITGLPAAGKSTLGARLARELRLPFVTKDEYKQLLFDGLPGLTNAQAGPLSFSLMYHVAGVTLAAGMDIVLETHFYRGISEAIIQGIAEQQGARLAQVFCHAPVAELQARHDARVASGARPNIDAPLRYAELPAHCCWEPLELPGPLLNVDTMQDDAFQTAFHWAQQMQKEGR